MNLFILNNIIKSLKISLILITSMSLLMSCLIDDEVNDIEAINISGILIGCKTCENIGDTNMTIEACEYNNNTISYTIFVGGLVVVEDIIEMKEGETFDDYDCDYFNNINTESLD